MRTLARIIPSVLLAAAAISTAPVAAAQLHEADVILKVQTGQTVIGRPEGSLIVYDRWVFSGEFGKFGIPDATSDPGYDSEDGGLPANAIMGITIRRAARAWNGFDFSSLPPERIEIKKSQSVIQTPIVDPANCGIGDSLTLGKASASGKLHQHPAYVLFLDSGETPADGIYLLELEAWHDTPGNGASHPFWIIFTQNADPNELQLAVDFQDRRSLCPADLDQDGALTINDFIAYQTLFAIQDPFADFDGSCSLTIDDFIVFQTLFAIGCE